MDNATAREVAVWRVRHGMNQMGRPLVIPYASRGRNAVVCYVPVQDRFVTLLWSQLERR